MIHFTFALHNPFSKRKFFSKTIYLNSFGHKTLEIEYTRDNCIIEFWLRYRIRESHAGLMFSVSLLSYGINFAFEDNRHWDSTTNTWEKYDDEEGC